MRREWLTAQACRNENAGTLTRMNAGRRLPVLVVRLDLRRLVGLCLRLEEFHPDLNGVSPGHAAAAARAALMAKKKRELAGTLCDASMFMRAPVSEMSTSEHICIGDPSPTSMKAG